MNTPIAYPLQWPRGWPKTEAIRRERAQFKCTLSSALKSLHDEVRRLGGSGLVLSSNYSLGEESPKDSGVVAYFVRNKTNVAIPCDRWTRIEHNVRAIALTVEALRGMDRWGAKHMIEAMFSGFKALPPAGDQRSCWEILEITSGYQQDQALSSFRRLARINHPDNGGSSEKMAIINSAWEEAKREKGWT